MKAAIYCRVSTEEQRDRQTIDLQRDFARRYCELHEIPVATVYSDDGITGTLPLSERPEGRKLLEDAKQGAFDTVLLYRLDRLGRDPRLILNAVNELESLGIQLRSMTEPFDSSTPTGRFTVTILSGVAGLERETIMQRMAEGTARAVREGAWIGVVPFGYRRVGERRHARLEVSDDPILGFHMSEKEVVLLVYKLCIEDGLSALRIAKHLNLLAVPTAYPIAGRHANGKRQRHITTVWAPGKVLRILSNTVYKGEHYFGRHTKKKRELIQRPVPAIVDPATWERAREAREKHQIWSPRNGKRNYLLRGMMKCSLCGRNLCGTPRSGSKGNPNRAYYVCVGKTHYTGGAFQEPSVGRCASRPVPATLEDVVWADIESFLRNPGPVIEEVAESLDDMKSQVVTHRKEAIAAERALAAKSQEREAVLALYRRGRIDDATLDQQLDEVERERVGLTEALKDAQERLRGVEGASAHLRDAEALLRTMNARLDEPLTFALRRELVETLVDGILIETIPDDGKRKLIATIRYRFSPLDGESSFATQTNRDAWTCGSARRAGQCRIRTLLVRVARLASKRKK